MLKGQTRNSCGDSLQQDMETRKPGLTHFCLELTMYERCGNKDQASRLRNGMPWAAQGRSTVVFCIGVKQGQAEPLEATLLQSNTISKLC